MPRVLAGHPSPTGAQRAARRRVLLSVALGLAVAVLLAGGMELFRGPRFVARVGVRNRTPYLVDVAVTDGAHDGWTLLGAVEPGETVDVREVVDQGDTWVFRFTSGPAEGGRLTLTRDQLTTDGWRVSVPPDVAARLAQAGVATFAG